MANRTPPSEWAALFNPWGGGLVHMELYPVETMLHATLTLNDTQIKAAPSAPIIAIAAPGPGKLLVPSLAFIQTNFEPAAYTNVDPDAILYLAPGTPGDDIYEWSQYIPNSAAESLTMLTDLLSAARNNIWLHATGAQQDEAALSSWSLLPGLVNAVDSHDLTNLALLLMIENEAAGDFTGGDSANQLRLDVWYFVIDALA